MTAGLLLTDPVALGPYRLLGRLGVGGMGQVFLAESPGGLAAVKVIRPELAADTEFRKRFAREVAAARKVSGAYTAVLIDADTEGAVPWLATAYIAGPPLSAVVRDIGPLPPASLRPLASGLVEALRAIHAAGVVHRDLKPSNVLLADDGPRVIDFGVSHAVEASTMTESGAILGSPGYMSPEQAQGHRVGPASDVFSLGALLAYAATGTAPFGDGSVAALVYRVVNAEPDLDRVPAEFSPLIERCLSKVPDERPGLDDLLSELGGEPIQENWLPAAVTSTFSRYAPAARVAAMPVLEPPPVPGPSPAEASATETAAPVVSAPETPARETPAGGTAPPARRRGQVRRWQQGAVIAAAVIVVVGVAVSWLALGTGGSHPSGAPAAALATRSASSPGASATAGGKYAKDPGQHGSSASSVTSRKPTPPPSPSSAVSVHPLVTPSQSLAPSPSLPQSQSPAPSASSISGVSIGDDPSAIVASEVSVDFGGCTAWLDNDGSGNLSGMLNTSLYQSCGAELYRSGGPTVSLSASWGAERTSALSDTGHTMWICVWPAGDQAGQQCSSPFAINGGTPTRT